MSQLPLDFRFPAHTRFDTFIDESGRGVEEHLRTLAHGGRSDIVWIAGPTHAGKTHLLQAACREAGERGLRSIYLACDRDLPPGALAELGGLDLVAVDDVTALAGDPDRELALFSLINDFYQQPGVLLLAGRTVPAGAGFDLPDLASRARAAVVYPLEPLSDEARGEALDALARARGVELEPAAAAYLLRRVRRDMREVAGWLDRIDRESLAAQRKVTVPFVRELLLGGTTADDTERRSEPRDTPAVFDSE